MQKRFVITSIQNGLRKMSQQNTGSNTYVTKEEAEQRLEGIIAHTDANKLLFTMGHSFELREVDCYDNGDSTRTVFADETKQVFIVLLNLVHGGSHQPIFRDDDDNLELYDTREAAQAAIDECVEETIEATQNGDMEEAYSQDDYDVVEATYDGRFIQYTWHGDKYIMERKSEDSEVIGNNLTTAKDVKQIVEEAVQLAAMVLLDSRGIEYKDNSIEAFCKEKFNQQQ